MDYLGSNLVRDGVRILPIKNLIRPEHHNHFVTAHIRNVMRPARNRFNHFWLFTIGKQLISITRHYMTKTKACFTLDHQKLLALGMVMMATARNSRMRGKKRKLPGVFGF